MASGGLMLANDVFMDKPTTNRPKRPRTHSIAFHDLSEPATADPFVLLRQEKAQFAILPAFGI